MDPGFTFLGGLRPLESDIFRANLESCEPRSDTSGPTTGAVIIEMGFWGIGYMILSI